MARSLEVRVPFLDHRVVEYCQTIPSSLKLRGGTTKYLLKHAARGIVPDRIIDKPKIGFLSEAVDDWFRAQSSGVAGEYLFRKDAPYAEFVSRDGVRDLADRHARAGGRSEGWALFAVLLLEIWLSTYLPRATTPAPAPKQASAAVGG
jgi:asparagine synthase (glutamine-hydrolysing)